jgi:predicted nucleic-acid-binding protein
MKGFDTNLLVRLLVKDDPSQAAVVARVIEDAASSDDTILLNPIVLCETVWVLESAYGLSKDVIGDVLEKILLTQEFEVDRREVVWKALHRYRTGKGDFADYVIGESNLLIGCDATLTFDRSLKGEAGFELLGAR